MKMFSISLCFAMFMVVNVSDGGIPSSHNYTTCASVHHTSIECRSCQAYGVQNLDCCFPNEAIDIDSLTDRAQSKRLYEALQAQLIFDVPADVELILAGQKMTTGGKERSFLVSVNDQKLTYRYDIRVDAVRGGQLYFKKQQLKALKAGAILKVTVKAAKVADGEIPEISITSEPIMVGGPQKGDEKPPAAVAVPGIPEAVGTDVPKA